MFGWHAFALREIVFSVGCGEGEEEVRMRISRVCAAVILGVLLSSAGSGGVTAPADAAPTGARDSLQGNSPELFPGNSLADDLRVAITAVNGYWAAHWSDFFTGIYTPPRYNRATLGLYDGFSPYAPTCRGKKMAPLNAGYCRPEDFLAWDETFMRNGYAKGDGFVYTTVAHEWGHAIQNRLRVVAVARESQADCLAGAELYGSARDGRFQFQAGDEAEIARTLNDTADYMPPANGGRGTPSDRIGAFRLGATYGVPGCLRIR